MPSFSPGIHPVVFILFSFEILILFYLVLYKLGRKKTTIVSLDIQLLALLITYNATGTIAHSSANYSTSDTHSLLKGIIEFITPCFFPYYTIRAFKIRDNWFNDKTARVLFFLIPYLFLFIVFLGSDAMHLGKNLIAIPTIYALWSLFTIADDITAGAKTDRILLLFCLVCWLLLPVCKLISIAHAVEIILTNTGFLSLFCIHVNRTIHLTRYIDQQRLYLAQQVTNLQQELSEIIETMTHSSSSKVSQERFNQCCETYKLSKREKEIAWLVNEGNTYRKIGELLFISDRTVSKHIEHIFEKVGASNREQMRSRLTNYVR